VGRNNSLIDENIPAIRLKHQQQGKGKKSRKTHLDSKCGTAESCGPYRVTLSHNSDGGMARSFMFFGIARISVRDLVSFDRLGGRRVVVVEETRALFRRLNYKELLALFGFVMCAGINGCYIDRQCVSWRCTSMQEW